MPLRDHFRPPLDNRRSWEELHGQWPAVIVQTLARRLPRRYIAAPGIHSGSLVEIDVATFEEDDPAFPPPTAGNGNGGVATAVWAPPQPTLTLATDLPTWDEYEVRVYDSKRNRRLVAAVEIVSPANKDRPQHRQAFLGKCVALLQQFVSVTIVDLVTTRNFNLFHELLTVTAKAEALPDAEPPLLYASACRQTEKGNAWLLETWSQPLTLGQPLPTLPLWLADNLAVPLELEESYETTCRDLRIP